MKTTLTAALLAASCAAGASGAAHWGYTGHQGPSHWGELDTSFGTCASGKNQSPIDLTGLTDAELKPIAFHYQTQGTEIVNNGHTVQVNVAPGNTIAVNGHTFELKQFHVHTPSENHIDGKSFPVEAHFVHADKDGNLAVVAVMMADGKANAELAKAWADMPGKAGMHRALSGAVSPAALLPADRDYYRYDGSLTTPPCSEGVTWLVMKDSVNVSPDQVAKFAGVLPGPNNRPVQPINARMVVR